MCLGFLRATKMKINLNLTNVFKASRLYVAGDVVRVSCVYLC